MLLFFILSILLILSIPFLSHNRFNGVRCNNQTLMLVIL
jgi:hypothetical protein